MTKHIISAAFIGLMAFTPMTANAQASAVQAVAIQNACRASAASCRNVVTAALRAAAREPNATLRNSLLAVIAGAVISGGRDLGNPQVISVILNVIAGQSTDGQQQRNLTQIASTIGSGGSFPTDAEIATAVAASS